MVSLKLALVDPDTALPLSPAAATSLSFYRVEDNFESGQTINAIFLEACQTVFSDQCISSDRGLHRTIFSGKDRDSGSTISVTVINPTALWDEVINEFDPLFNVTFKLHSKHIYDPVAATPVSVAKFPLFKSISERKEARLQLQDDESGDHLPLLRAEWCQLWKSRMFNHEPFVEIQWTAIVQRYFLHHEIRFASAVINNKDHQIYTFISNLCIFLKNLNKRWNKIVAAHASFSACPFLSLFFYDANRPYSDRDDENHIDNPGML